MAGPHDPVVTTPARAPGSVRRTSSLDCSRPDGPGGRLVIDARACDLTTGHDGSVARLDEIALQLTLDDASREITALEATPPRPALDRLVGTHVVGGFRRVLGELLPDERRERTLAHLLVDDLPGAALVSGYALLHSGAIGPGRKAGVAGETREPGAGMADLCAGWAADGSMLQVTRATGVVPTPLGPPAPPVEAADDPLSWHAMAPLGPHATRRRRRIDVLPADAGRHTVDVHFRDSHCDAAGAETVVHEYTASAAVDGPGRRLVALAPRAQVLPWQECPGALASASRLAGTALDELATSVRRELVGVISCTHLNDTLRSLADVDALLALLPDIG